MSEDWRGWYQNKPGSGSQPTEAYQAWRGRRLRRAGQRRREPARGVAGPAAEPVHTRRGRTGTARPGRWRWAPGVLGAAGAARPADRADPRHGRGRADRGRRRDYFWLNGKLNRSVALPATSLTSAGTNWLITGSDSRAGLSRAEIDALHVGFDEGTLNSDSIMLLHMGSGRPVLISIPRDSYVDIPGHGWNKINAALAYGGANLLIQTVEDVTGLKIDHYMGIGFGGLVAVVNKIGGVQICLKTAINDSYSGVNLSAGCHNLNGNQALAFVRDRHSFATEDLQRIQDQRAFLPPC